MFKELSLYINHQPGLCDDWMSINQNQLIRTILKWLITGTWFLSQPHYTLIQPPHPLTQPSPQAWKADPRGHPEDPGVKAGDDSCLTNSSGGVGLETGWRWVVKGLVCSEGGLWGEGRMWGFGSEGCMRSFWGKGNFTRFYCRSFGFLLKAPGRFKPVRKEGGEIISPKVKG